MDKAKFFAALRRKSSSLFGTSLSKRQVVGLEALIDAGRDLPLSHMAHVLAECHHETGGGLYPVKETVFASSKDKTPSDATVIARLNHAYAKGRLPWVKTPYWRDGAFGRGLIQITHEDNYRKMSPIVGVNLTGKNKARALEPSIAAQIAVEGCRRGVFRGKKLSDYDKRSGYDHRAARNIVNGDTREIGPVVAKYAAEYETALKAAGWHAKPFVRPDVEPVEPSSGGGLLAAIMAALSKLLRRA